MKLLLSTNKSKLYFVYLPNHIDREKIPEIVQYAEINMLLDETATKYSLHSDDYLTDYERKQIDIYGKIVNPILQLTVD